MLCRTGVHTFLLSRAAFGFTLVCNWPLIGLLLRRTLVRPGWLRRTATGLVDEAMLIRIIQLRLDLTG